MNAVFFGVKKSRDESLPAQKALLEACLRPGRKVDLVLGPGPEAGRADIRSTILRGLDRKRLLLAQTDPRLGKTQAGDEVFVTFLAESQNGGWIRVGYRTVLQEAPEADGPEGGPRESMLVVPAPKKLGRLTLRLHRRLAPPAKAGLRLFVLPGRAELALADISQSGARFFHPGDLAWQPGDKLTLLLAGAGRELELKAQVVRGQKNPGVSRSSSGMTAVHFLPGQAEAASGLSSILNRMVSAGGRASVSAPPAG